MLHSDKPQESLEQWTILTCRYVETRIFTSIHDEKETFFAHTNCAYN